MFSLGRNLILFVLIILGCVFLHSYRFHQVEYRQDEINTVHAASVLDAAGIVDWLSYEGTHPPGWRIMAADWVRTFGYEREIARFQSTLFTILALAFIFRLGKDLFNTQTGILAVLFVGLLPYAQWHLHELRPYAPLIMISAALQVVFLRWLQKRSWQLAFTYIVLGGLGLQVHYFTGFIVVAHTTYILVAIKWQTRLFWQIALMGNLILLSFAWWLPAIYHGAFVIRDNGINYGSGDTQESISTFILDLNYAPLVLLPLLFWGTKHILVKQTPRRKFDVRFVDWRRAFILIVSLGIFFSAALANNFVQILTFRNLSVTLPLIGIAFGVSVQKLPRYAMWSALLAYIIWASTTFIYYAPQVPHSQMASFINEDITPNDKFIVNIAVKGATAPAAIHYFRDHLTGQPDSDHFFVINELNSNQVGFKYNIDPFPYEIARDTYTTEDLTSFDLFLSDSDHVYYILFHRWEHEDDTHDIWLHFEPNLQQNFEVVRQQTWHVEDNDPDAAFTIIEYRQK